MMRNVQHTLDCLPQSFSDDPQTKLLGLCADFAFEIGQHTKGDSDHAKFLQDLHNEFQKFAKEIAETKPNFEIKPKSAEPIIGLPIALPPPPMSMGVTDPVRLPEEKEISKSPF